MMDIGQEQRSSSADEDEDHFSEKDWRRLLRSLGEDPNRQGLVETPKRIERAWEHWTSGYKQNPVDILRAYPSRRRARVEGKKA
jgi:GTP cyclohydrolase I